MSKITQFRTISKPVRYQSEARIESTYDLFCSMNDEMDDGFTEEQCREFEDVMDEMDIHVEKLMEQGQDPEVLHRKFRMHAGSIARLIERYDDAEPDEDWMYPGFFMAYTSEDKESGWEYYFLINITSRTDQDDPDLYEEGARVVRMDRKRRIQTKDEATREWHDDEGLQEIVKLYNKNKATTDLLNKIKTSFNAPILMMDSGHVISMVKSAEQILPLYDRMDGVADFGFLCTGNPHETDDSVIVGLTADDPLRHGSFLYYTGGEYIICQACNLRSELCDFLYLENDADENDMDFTAFYREAAKTKNADEACLLCRHMWDRYNKNAEWITAPLSAKAYIDIRMDEDGQFRTCIYFTSSRMDMTDQESKNLEWLRKVIEKPADWEEDD